MKKYGLLLFFSFLLSATLQAQNTSCPCCSAPYRAFDFWLGEWNVYDTLGKKVGENSIVLMQDSCLIRETWISSGGKFTGTSYNYFYTADSTWNQTWVSNQASPLELKGSSPESGKMILKSELKNGKQGKYRDKVTWTLQKDGSVIQQWDILKEDGSFIQTVFFGIYRKK